MLTTRLAFAQSGDRVTLLFETAENQLNQGRYQEAIQSFSKVITLKVDHADAYYYRGTAREKCNDLEGAFIDYSIALEWKNDFAEALLRRGQVLYQREQYDAARSDFQKLLALPHGETHDIFYRKSTYEQGVNRIITAQGATDIVFNYLGLIALKKEQFEEAVTWLDSAISLFSKDADYYVHRGEANEKMLRYDKAKTDYEKALSISPDHALAQQHLSSLSRTRGNIDESNRYLSAAIEQNPHLPYAYLERAYYRAEIGDYRGAIEDYSAALKIDSLDAEVWVNRGLAFEKTNNLRAAYRDYTKAITLDEDLSNAWLSRANVLVKQNKFEEALEDYGIAIFYDPNYALAFFNRALVNYQVGNRLAACNDLEKASELGQSINEKMKNKICSSQSY